MPTASELIAAFDLAEDAIFDHVGYAHDWRVFPLDISTSDHAWMVEGDRGWCFHSPNAEHLRIYVGAEHFDDEYDDELIEAAGEDVYGGVIYTYRHLSKFVFRGPELTIVLLDTQQDLNIVLALFRTANELKR